MTELPVVAEAFALVGATAPDERLIAATLFLMTAASVSGVARLWLAWASQRFVFDFGHELSVDDPAPGARPALCLAHRPQQPRHRRLAGKGAGHGLGGRAPGVQAITAAILAAFIVAALIAIDAVSALAAAAVLALLYLGVSAAARRRLGRNAQTVNVGLFGAGRDRPGEPRRHSRRDHRRCPAGLSPLPSAEIDRDVQPGPRPDRLHRRGAALRDRSGRGSSWSPPLALILAEREGGFAAALPISARSRSARSGCCP